MEEHSIGANVLTNRVIGAAIEVHRELGPGFMEAVYENALTIELDERGIKYQRQLEIPVLYKNRNVGLGRIDLLVDSTLVIELKAVEALAPVHTSQVLSYLKALRLELGLLINFNVPLLKDGIKRIIHTS